MLKTFFLLMTAASSALWPFFLTAPPEAPLSNLMAEQHEASGIMNNPALASFFQQLNAIENRSRTRPIRIIQFGDSHTKADLFTGAVRSSFVRDFGGGPANLIKRTAYRPAGNQTSVYRPLGINGARAKRLRDMSAAAPFLQSVSEDQPDLIVIAYGTNEVTDGDWTVDSYSQMLLGIINRLRSAAPNASVLIIGPPDRSVQGARGWTSVTRMPLLLEAQRQAAFLSGAAFWSEYDAMGGAGSMNAWVARGLGRFDHVHFSAAGYSKLAGLFYGDLMDAYRNRHPGLAAPSSDLDLRVMRGVPVTPH